MSHARNANMSEEGQGIREGWRTEGGKGKGIKKQLKSVLHMNQLHPTPHTLHTHYALCTSVTLNANFACVLRVRYWNIKHTYAHEYVALE